MSERWAISGDLALGWVVAALVLGAASLILLATELGSRGVRARGWLVVTGFASVLLLLLAVLRPVRVHERESTVGARVLVLLDGSHSVDLPADGDASRRIVEERVLAALRTRLAAVRMRAAVFGRGEAIPVGGDGIRTPPSTASDLGAALDALGRATDDRPQAIVVVSDGRLDRPGADGVESSLRGALGGLDVPIHTVALSRRAPKDAAVRAVRIAGTLVAHQPARVEVEVACTGDLACGDVPLTVREWHLDEPAVVRASAVAHAGSGSARVEVEVTLDRAGRRILEVALEAPGGDTIPENNRRFVTVDVARDRVRLLHVAGRPTYDVRALRTWLKSDASVDVVAFFILRTRTDDVAASQDELALIPFPVDELFTQHLQSFDAVILQDFDAEPYGLSIHLERLADYVKQGGGLVMVGGPDAFVSGNYANTPLAEVLPVGLRGLRREEAVDPASFVPVLTRAGRRAPVLEPLMAIVGERWPEAAGANVVGDARDGATVLLEHPRRRTASGAAMPILALGEAGSGRTIALATDASHALQFSAFASESGGRAHGAFWDAMLGWLMRDPRFEPARLDAPEGCLAGVPAVLRLRALFADEGAEADVTIHRMGRREPIESVHVTFPRGDAEVPVKLAALQAGAYTATVQLAGEGRPAPSRHDFACEGGGDEWADPRPDVARLEAIAKATSGVSVFEDDVARIPLPVASRVIEERRVQPWVRPWVWAVCAAIALGAHWLVRRRSGLV